MRLRFFATCALAACGGHYKVEHVGGGAALIAARGSEPAAPAPGPTLPAGGYDFALRFTVPRAQLVEWRVTCAGVERSGWLGETFDAYRTRRLAQLRAERNTERGVVASVLGAALPSAHASAPGVQVDASGQAAGQAIAAAAIDDHVELPAGDVGAGELSTKLHLDTDAAGSCAVTAIADDATVVGGYDITRIHDLDAESRARRDAANAVVAARQVAIGEAAVAVRGRLTAQLIATGADPSLRARIRAAALARAEAAHAAFVAVETQRTDAILSIRGRLEGWLITECGAVANHRARVAAEAQAALDARAHLTLEVRTRLVASLVSLGARERPPMPAQLAESPGDPPFPNARWRAGAWTWTGATWQWTAGGWWTTDHFGETGGDPSPSTATATATATATVSVPATVPVPVPVPVPATVTVSVPVPVPPPPHIHVIIHEHPKHPPPPR